MAISNKKLNTILESLKETDELLKSVNEMVDDETDIDDSIEQKILEELDSLETEETPEDEVVADDEEIDIDLTEEEEIDIEDDLEIEDEIVTEEDDLEIEDDMVTEEDDMEIEDDLEIEDDIEIEDDVVTEEEEIDIDDALLEELDGLDGEEEIVEEEDSMEKIYEDLKMIKERKAALESQDVAIENTPKPELVAEAKHYKAALSKLGKMYNVLETKFNTIVKESKTLKNKNNKLVLEQAKAVKANGILANTSLKPSTKKAIIGAFDACTTINEVNSRYLKVIKTIKASKASSNKLNSLVEAKQTTTKSIKSKAVNSEASKEQARIDYLTGVDSNTWETQYS